MSAIGGYFELELRKGVSLHPNAIALNSGKNCLEFLLLHKHYTKVYVPYYTCDVVYKPFAKLGIPYEFYSVDCNFEPTNLPNLKNGEAFLYTNYFGLKQDYVRCLAKRYDDKLIVDNAQAYYAKPIKGVNTYYSPRKFVGVPDGGFLYMDGVKDTSMLEHSTSYGRIGHLVKRIDLSAEEAYQDFKREDESLVDEPIMLISKLTQAVLESIDNREICTKRRENYNYLHTRLKNINLLNVELPEEAIPMVYPLYVEDAGGLRSRLINEHIYCATYWPNVLRQCEEEKIDYQLAKNIIPLPIDQRYGEKEMKQIITYLCK